MHLTPKGRSLIEYYFKDFDTEEINVSFIERLEHILQNIKCLGMRKIRGFRLMYQNFSNPAKEHIINRPRLIVGIAIFYG